MKKIMFISFCLLALVTVRAQVRIKPNTNTHVDVNINVSNKSKTTGADKPDSKPLNTNNTMSAPDTVKPNLQPDDSYKGPAKTYVNAFFRELNLIEQKGLGSSSVKNMERAVGMIKEKDPAYNTSGMDAEIKTWKEKEAAENAARLAQPNQQQVNMDKSRNETMAKLKLEQLLENVFDIGAFSFRNLETAQAENDAYKAKTLQLLGMKDALAVYKADPKTGGKYNRLIDKMKLSYDRNFSTFTDRVDRIMSQSTGEKGGNWENAYYEMQAEQIHWDAAQKIFPEEPKFAEAYQKITAVVNKYGSLDNMHAKTQVNKKEKIKDTKVPAATVVDAALEKMFIDAFNKKYKDAYKGTAIKAVLLQSGWQTERNEISGMVTGRIRQGAIVYKGNDGKCYLVSVMHLYQEYIGGSFQNTKAVYAQNGQEMLCENVQ